MNLVPHISYPPDAKPTTLRYLLAILLWFFFFFWTCISSLVHPKNFDKARENTRASKSNHILKVAFTLKIPQFLAYCGYKLQRILFVDFSTSLTLASISSQQIFLPCILSPPLQPCALGEASHIFMPKNGPGWLRIIPSIFTSL